MGYFGRHVAPLEFVHDLFPQFVVLVSHMQRKLIQPNIALMLFCIVAFHAIFLKKSMSGSILLSDLSGLFGIHAESGKAKRKRGGPKMFMRSKISKVQNIRPNLNSNIYLSQIYFFNKRLKKPCEPKKN